LSSVRDFDSVESVGFDFEENPKEEKEVENDVAGDEPDKLAVEVDPNNVDVLEALPNGD